MNVLEERVLQLIGEDADAPDIYPDTDAGLEPIRDSLNDAIEEITMITGSYKRKIYVPLVENQMFYRLNFAQSSLVWITDAWLVNQKRRLTQRDIIYLNKMDPRWMISSGSQLVYVPIGDDIVAFWRRPSGNSDVVELQCVVIPSRYTSSTDRIKLRSEYQWACVHYAVSEWWASRGDAKEALMHHGKYLELLGLKESYPYSREKVYQSRSDKEASNT